MSISIYYSVQRAKPLTAAEASCFIDVFRRYNDSYEWYEGLGFYRPVKKLVGKADWRLEGSSKLSPNDNELQWTQIQLGCRAISECRRQIRGATWDVHVEDHTIPWDEKSRAFDPNR